MVGYPSHLNTKEDYEYVRLNFPKEQWQKDFQDLLDTRYEYRFDHFLADDEVVNVDVPYRIMLENVDGKELPQRALYVQFYVENNRMVQLGYTEEEIQNILAA